MWAFGRCSGPSPISGTRHLFLGRLAYFGNTRDTLRSSGIKGACLHSGCGFLLVGQLEHVDVLEVNFTAGGALGGDQVLFGQDLNTSCNRFSISSILQAGIDRQGQVCETAKDLHTVGY